MRSALKGNASAAAELSAAKALRDAGMNVHFRETAGDAGAQGLRTSDFLVGGDEAGRGGVPYEVYSPRTATPGRVADAVAKKLPDLYSLTALPRRWNTADWLSRAIQEDTHAMSFDYGVVSHRDRDDLYAELSWNNVQWGEIAFVRVNDRRKLVLTLYAAPNGQAWVFDLREAQEVIEKAAERLLEVEEGSTS